MSRIPLPAAFLERLQNVTGDEFSALLSSMEQPAPVSVRLNPWKQISVFDKCENVPWSTGGRYLPERISFTLDPLFHAGCYYVQEASSMYLEKVIGKHLHSTTPVRILDLCAAPGGKSTHLASLVPEGSLVVSNEVISSRNNTLRYNIEKWGTDNVVVTQNDATEWGAVEGFFDVILVDAPCSGEGLFRKDPQAISEWSPANVDHCSHRQSEILDAIYPALKKGGCLVYSTCTFEYSENEHQVKELVRNYGMKPVSLEDNMNGVICDEWGCRFYPHRIKGEGFFISALIKTEDAGSISQRKQQYPSIGDELIKQYLQNPERYQLYRKNEEMYAFPLQHLKEIQLLMDRMFVRKAGIHLGTLKGKDLVPSHELALCIYLNTGVPLIELERDEAIRYLSCEQIQVPGTYKGWAVVTYSGFPLGWIKVVGNRVNNYFPKNQRILKR